MSEQFLFVRHMMKLSDPEAIQAAIQAGTLAEPYIINITQDSSVSGYESKGIYIQESSTGTPSMNVKEYEEEEPVWSSPQLVPNMYTADPSNGEYTDASGNFDICYAEDDREGWKYVENLYFFLNSQYLEGWGSTAETIASETAFGSNTPIVFITEKDALDAAVEYWSNTGGFSESYTLARLAYCVVNDGSELSYNGNTNATCTWHCVLNDGTETSFWGEDIEYGSWSSDSLEGYYMEPDNNKTPEYYILVAYKKEEEEILEASKDNILRAPIDYESMFKVYKAGIFSAYDYSEEGDDTPDSSGGDSSSNGLTYSYSPTIHEEGGTTFTVLSITTTMDSSTAAEYNGVYYAICPVEDTKYEYYTYVNDEEPEEGEELPMPTANQVIDMYVAWEIIPTEDAPYNGYSYDLALNGIESIKYMVTNPYTSDCGGGVSLDDEVDYMIIAIPAHCTLYVNQYNDHTEMNYYCDVDSPLISSETFTYSAPVIE